jgi:hypothetical protein
MRGGSKWLWVHRAAPPILEGSPGDYPELEGVEQSRYVGLVKEETVQVRDWGRCQNMQEIMVLRYSMERLEHRD